MMQESPQYLTAYASVGAQPSSKLTDIKAQYTSNAKATTQNKRPAHHKRLEFVKPSNSAAQMINDCISLPV